MSTYKSVKVEEMTFYALKAWMAANHLDNTAEAASALIREGIESAKRKATEGQPLLL